MSKSYVTLEQKVCQVCGHPYDTGSIFMDMRLRNSFDKNTVTGYGLCEEHQKLYEDGYIALVEIDNVKSSRSSLNQNEANRTGNICHLKEEAFYDIFDVNRLTKDLPMVFVEVGVISKIQDMVVTQGE